MCLFGDALLMSTTAGVSNSIGVSIDTAKSLLFRLFDSNSSARRAPRFTRLHVYMLQYIDTSVPAHLNVGVSYSPYHADGMINST